MTTYTPTLSTATVPAFQGFGPDPIANVMTFTSAGHGLESNDVLYVSSGSITNVALKTSPSETNITVGNGSGSNYAAFVVHKVNNNVFHLKVGNVLLVQQSGQTFSNSSVAFKEATGQVATTNNAGGQNYNNGDAIRFALQGVDNNSLNGYNFVFYQSGLEAGVNGIRGSNVNTDLDNNPSSSYTGTFVAGTPGYYTLSGVTADGTTSNLFSTGQAKLLLFVATAGGGGGGGGGSGGKFAIKGTGTFKISGNGKITIK